MRRPRLVAAAATAALAVVAAGALSSCSTVDPYAVEVNGEEISQRDYLQQLKDLAGNEEFVANQAGLRGAGGDGTVSMDFSQTLTAFNVRYLLEQQELERRGGQVTDAQRAQAEELAKQSFSTEAAWTATPARFQRQFVEWIATELSLQAIVGSTEPDAAAVRATYDADPDQFAKLCVSHILLDDEAGAEQVVEQLAAGTDFASLAAQSSLDTQSGPTGGQLRNADGSCATASAFRQAFGDGFVDAVLATGAGQVTAPISTSQGWHVVLVEEVQPTPFEEAEDEVRQATIAANQSAFTDLVTDLGRTGVRINPRFGIWDPATGNVLPPDAEELLTENQQGS